MDLLMDKPYRDRGRPDLSFEVEGMKTAVHIDGTLNDSKDTDRGWDIEIAIPFAALKSITNLNHPKDGDQWRVNFAGGVPGARKAGMVGVESARPHGYAHAGTLRLCEVYDQAAEVMARSLPLPEYRERGRRRDTVHNMTSPHRLGTISPHSTLEAAI